MGQAHEQRTIFSSLVEIGHGTPDTRRMGLFNEILTINSNPEDVRATVLKLADARLITTDNESGKETVTIAHEKLIEAWPWLKKLVDENRDTIALQNEIAQDPMEWNENDRDSSYLYFGARLSLAQEKLAAQEII